MAEETENTQIERKINRAVRFVSDYWIPCNPITLKRIQNGLFDGVYDTSFDTLIKDICSDVSIFSYCLRELFALMNRRNVMVPNNVNPIAVLRQSGIEQLKDILGSRVSSFSFHKLAEGNKYQVERISEVVLSATTASQIADHHGIESDVAYSSAVLRQLGLTLIAWNYSSMYQKAVSSLKPGDKLDLVLAEKFGFSPTTLALKVLERWGLGANVCLSLGLDPDEASYEEGEAICSNLAKVCQVGEALARANAPDIYPSAKDDWDYAIEEVKEALGENGVEIIQERYQETCAHYVQYVPKLFSAGLITAVKAGAADKNPYIEDCDPAARFEISKVYKAMVPGVITEASIKTFIKESVPGCHFNSGVIFTFDPGLGMLLPQTKIGIPRLIRLEPVDPNVSVADNFPIVRAYNENRPMIISQTYPDGTPLSGIAGVFGISQRMGVLYLEIASEIAENSLVLVHFKALAFTLSEALRS